MPLRIGRARPGRNGGVSRNQASRRPASGRPALLTHLRRTWSQLVPERRVAAAAALGLLVTLFLPWYQETVIATLGRSSLQSSSASLTGWGAFSFVEAAVLVVAAAVLTLLYQRAEGRPFRLPGGDGGAISALGAWTCLLIVWRMFDKQGATSHGQYATTYGIEWGIFVALAAALMLTWAGRRVRQAERNQPEAAPGRPQAAPSPSRPRGRGRAAEQSWAGADWPVPKRSERATPTRRRSRSETLAVEADDPPEMPATRRSLPPPANGGSATANRGAAPTETPTARSPELPTRAIPPDPAADAAEEQLTIPFDEERP
jgi:hypothetical protein